MKQVEKKPNYKELMNEINDWSSTYSFTFQFWGKGNNNCYIEKDGIDLWDTGGHIDTYECLIAALHYIYKINNTPIHSRVC